MTHTEAQHILCGTCTVKDALTYMGATEDDLRAALKICAEEGYSAVESYMALAKSKANRVVEREKQK